MPLIMPSLTWSPLMALTETGTSCRLSVRFWAVTSTSSRAGAWACASVGRASITAPARGSMRGVLFTRGNLQIEFIMVCQK